MLRLETGGIRPLVISFTRRHTMQALFHETLVLRTPVEAAYSCRSIALLVLLLVVV